MKDALKLKTISNLLNAEDYQQVVDLLSPHFKKRRVSKETFSLPRDQKPIFAVMLARAYIGRQQFHNAQQLLLSLDVEKKSCKNMLALEAFSFLLEKQGDISCALVYCARTLVVEP